MLTNTPKKYLQFRFTGTAMSSGAGAVTAPGGSGIYRYLSRRLRI